MERERLNFSSEEHANFYCESDPGVYFVEPGNDVPLPNPSLGVLKVTPSSDAPQKKSPSENE